VARVIAVFDDLLLGSNVLGMLQAAGHSATLTGGASGVAVDDAAVLIVDLGAGGFDGVDLVERLRSDGSLGSAKTIGVYSHVDVDTRRRADAAGFDLVVPRSRMAREGADLVARLAGSKSDGS
jgi:DNA-binding NarL/FixJ family response regulator